MFTVGPPGRRPPRPPMFFPHNYYKPPTVIDYFKKPNGEIDFEKISKTVGHVNKIVTQVEPIVKQVKPFIKNRFS